MLREAELGQICGWEDWTSQLTSPLSLASLQAGGCQDTIARLKHHNTQASRGTEQSAPLSLVQI